ncbi:MAG: (4Fe-4S)-binding protein [Candidatus Thorarchaeota archaeon]|nr:(4Fe-4S)-binding protein [Candidatus Thorarchaeota archaeon]
MTAEIAVISGKGGTGKTTFSAAFAALANGIVIADCDVDAPDMHILLQPHTKQTMEFKSSKVASINQELCTQCGVCHDNCRFDAANPPEINAIACEGCGVCAYLCPEEAISMDNRVSGMLYYSETRFGPMSHAKLLPGEGNSGKLVTDVRRQAQEMAKERNLDRILIDGSPGIGCPVIATVTGISIGIIVTEPTMSGIHDMERVAGLLDKFGVSGAVIINKYDLNVENTQQIEEYCQENGLYLLGRVAFDSIMTESMVAAKTLPEFAPSHEITGFVRKMWSAIEEILLQEKKEKV